MMMVNDCQVELFRGQIEDTFVLLMAEIKDGRLTLSGQEFGSLPKKNFGDFEYEYYYSLDETNTERFFEIMGIEAFGKIFSGPEACEKLREICQKNEIHYEFYSI